MGKEKNTKRGKDGKFVAKTPVAPVVEAAREPLKKRSEIIDTDHEAFGGHVSDDDTFIPLAHFIRVMSFGEVGVFVGDGKDVVVCAAVTEADGSKPMFGQPIVMSDKEAKRLGKLLINMAGQAKSARLAQQAHRDLLPMKKKKGK